MTAATPTPRLECSLVFALAQPTLSLYICYVCWPLSCSRVKRANVAILIREMKQSSRYQTCSNNLCQAYHCLIFPISTRSDQSLYRVHFRDTKDHVLTSQMPKQGTIF
ncbi:hypothetical protein BDV97DRAFT_350377 [Delphinella strobiligena]|nr:hypothetical protein BDV97DRAFT_350377 [Delphinella strobiligena]